MYKLFLTFRYLRKQLIVHFAIAAVTLCVALVLVQRSVMGGWVEQVKQRARGLLGDVIVDNQSYAGFPLYEEFIGRISAWPEIEQATPVLYTYGLVRISSPGFEMTRPVSVVGIRYGEVIRVNAFEKGLFYEAYYPGTTHLGPQRQPMLGLDPNAAPVPSPMGGLVRPPALPEPYQSALETARRRHQERFGRPLDAPNAVDGPDNTFLREHGLAIIPGEYAFSETDAPELAGEPWPGLIFGRDIVATRQSDGRYKRRFVRGRLATVTLWATSIGGAVDPVPIKQAFRYADDSRTGVYEIDSETVYCDFDLLQGLMGMGPADRIDPQTEQVVGRTPPRCSQIQIKLRPGLDRAAVAALTERLARTYHGLLDDPSIRLDPREQSLVVGVTAVTWEQSQAHIIGPVERERMMVTILFGIMSLVAVALILCILYMVVLQKTRDIGIVKAIGGSSAGVAAIFLLYGAAVGVVGGVLGCALGVLTVVSLNDIQEFLIRLSPALRVWDQSVYSFDSIPSEVNPVELLVILACAVATSMAGSLGAALRAGMMQPVEAIRYE
ncbi:MAG: hypothetical protein LC135_14670 [Phycisphaerae bacterium]|nr:ABC transporter permease [Phycisphaerae bacterium]MCZ2401086.1 hypothetical protein [Phycisphaerae bacterium]NUQ49217.1 ABC transporter permease [Phycisphaerae bacterium]